jgi:chromosome partitioning protein
LPTVAFVSPKGGAGKTTAALLLALGLAEQGRQVAMIDADPNRPLVAWWNLPNRPLRISVHAAPFQGDLPDALREAKAKKADWIILDTEGSARQGIAFTAVAPDLVITPLAASPLEAAQAMKAGEMVRDAAMKMRRKVVHACLLTRLPAAIRPKSVKQVVEQLRTAGMEILPTPIIEKEAFRTLFAIGGGFDALERHGAYGVGAARVNAASYVAAVGELLERNGVSLERAV